MIHGTGQTPPDGLKAPPRTGDGARSYSRTTRLYTSRRQIAENLVVIDEDPAVAGRIALMPFDAVIGDGDARAGIDVRISKRGIVARVGNHSDVLVALNLETIVPI